MRPMFLSCLLLLGCSREIDVEVKIEIIDTGSSNTSTSTQPSSEPSSQPSNEPSNQPSSQPSNEPSNQPSNQPTSEPTSDTANPGDPGQQQGGGVDFCSLTQSYIDCGNSDGNAGLSYCDDPENAGNWLAFFDCLVEAGSSDCADLNACSGMVP